MYTGKEIIEHQLITKSIILSGFEVDILKADDPTCGGKLMPVHAISKGGQHSIMYKAADEAYDGLVIGVGHKVKMRDGQHGVITKDLGHNGKGRMFRVAHGNGKTSDKFIHNLQITGHDGIAQQRDNNIIQKAFENLIS